MKNAAVFLALLALSAVIFAWGDAVVADELEGNVKVTGEIRARAEVDNRDFDSETKAFSFALLRTRLNFHFNSESPVSAFIQLQDSRMMGDPQLESGGLDNDVNLGLHQAYLLAKCSVLKELYFRIGRFEYIKGDQRVLGNVGWSNVGRTWDGAVAGFEKDPFNGELFVFLLDEGIQQIDDDVQLLGAYIEIADPRLDFFVLWDRNNRRDLDGKRELSRLTAGLYRYGEFSKFDYTTNLAYQFGRAEHDSVDLAAFLATLEIGYSVDTHTPFRVAAGVDITSGDDDPDDDKIKTYDNLYYTGHKFRGHMDFFVSPQTFDLSEFGLNDIYLKAGVDATSKLGVNGHFHLFQTNAKFKSRSDGSESSSLGSELDLFLVCKCRDRFAVEIGGSIFFPSEHWKGEDADRSYWMFVQTTGTF